MSAAKHTPGPWFYGIAYEPDAGEKPLSYSGPGYYANPGILSASGETIVGCDEYDIFGPLSGDQREWNVRLMTAAPDLLEALQAFMALDRSFGKICQKHLDEMAAEGQAMARAVQMARAAIAKATGEPQ